MARTKTTGVAPAAQPEILPEAARAIVVAQDAQAAADGQVRLLATSLGYQGALTVGTLEDEIRFYQRRTVEALLETGKRLLLLKEMTPHGEFTQRVEMLGFSGPTARRFMQAAAKTSKSLKLSDLSHQVKSASAFLELVTHDDDVLENLADLDDVDKMSASQLREALRQSKKDAEFAEEKRTKAEQRADKAEKKLRGKVPEVAPLDERVGPFQVEIGERQSALEKLLSAHLEAVTALNAWWTEETASASPDEPVPMPRAVLAVVQTLHDSVERTAAIVGGLQHQIALTFGVELQEARQYLMQDPAATGQADGNG